MFVNFILKWKIEIFYSFSTLRIFHTPHFSTLRVFHTPHFPHSSFSTPRIFHTPRFPHPAFSTLRIFHTPHFPHSAFSTPRIFHTPHFPHSALRTLRFPPNQKKKAIWNLTLPVQFSPLRQDKGQILHSPGTESSQMSQVSPGGKGGCWSFDLIDTLSALKWSAILLLFFKSWLFSRFFSSFWDSLNTHMHLTIQITAEETLFSIENLLSSPRPAEDCAWASLCHT